MVVDGVEAKGKRRTNQLGRRIVGLWDRFVRIREWLGVLDQRRNFLACLENHLPQCPTDSHVPDGVHRLEMGPRQTLFLCTILGVIHLGRVASPRVHNSRHTEAFMQNIDDPRGLKTLHL